MERRHADGSRQEVSDQRQHQRQTRKNLSHTLVKGLCPNEDKSGTRRTLVLQRARSVGCRVASAEMGEQVTKLPKYFLLKNVGFRLFVIGIFSLLMPSVSPASGYCKDMKNCAEAVESWCGGEADRDRDGDGIPCENVCKSREQTMREEEKIGCQL
jgi:hypothetical protein